MPAPDHVIAFMQNTLEASTEAGLSSEDLRKLGFSFLVGSCLRDGLNPLEVFMEYAGAAAEAIMANMPNSPTSTAVN